MSLQSKEAKNEKKYIIVCIIIFFSVYIQNSILKLIPLGLKHFHDFLVLKKLKIFLELVLNYNLTIFEKALNSNFVYGLHVIFKHGKSKELPNFVHICEELWRVPQIHWFLVAFFFSINVNSALSRIGLWQKLF